MSISSSALVAAGEKGRGRRGGDDLTPLQGKEKRNGTKGKERVGGGGFFWVSVWGGGFRGWGGCFCWGVGGGGGVVLLGEIASVGRGGHVDAASGQSKGEEKKRFRESYSPRWSEGGGSPRRKEPSASRTKT